MGFRPGEPQQLWVGAESDKPVLDTGWEIAAMGVQDTPAATAVDGRRIEQTRVDTQTIQECRNNKKQKRHGKSCCMHVMQCDVYVKPQQLRVGAESDKPGCVLSKL